MNIINSQLILWSPTSPPSDEELDEFILDELSDEEDERSLNPLLLLGGGGLDFCGDGECLCLRW